jgi:hypothetical protein
MRSKFQERFKKTGLAPGSLVHLGKGIALNKKIWSS